MNSLGSFFDRYAIMARQRPALLMLLPALVGAIVLFPSLRSWWATLLAVTSACGVSLALSEFAQSKGKALEPGLIKLWDGLPSVAMLRHRDTRLDTHTKARYKGFLEKAVPGLAFPDEASEKANPVGADQVYESATKWLLTQTRDKKVYSLLFEWNISYGFRRNMLGLRAYGTFLSVITLIVTLLWNILHFIRTESNRRHIVGWNGICLRGDLVLDNCCEARLGRVRRQWVCSRIIIGLRQTDQRREPEADQQEGRRPRIEGR